MIDGSEKAIMLVVFFIISEGFDLELLDLGTEKRNFRDYTV